MPFNIRETTQAEREKITKAIRVWHGLNTRIDSLGIDGANVYANVSLIVNGDIAEQTLLIIPHRLDQAGDFSMFFPKIGRTVPLIQYNEKG